MSEKSRAAVLMDQADKAYEAQDDAWFEAQSDADLGFLWGVVIASGLAMPGWDDEVFEALAKRGWFDQEVKAA